MAKGSLDALRQEMLDHTLSMGPTSSIKSSCLVSKKMCNDTTGQFLKRYFDARYHDLSHKNLGVLLSVGSKQPFTGGFRSSR